MRARHGQSSRRIDGDCGGNAPVPPAMSMWPGMVEPASACAAPGEDDMLNLVSELRDTSRLALPDYTR